MSNSPKKTKTDDTACVTSEAASIPVNGVARMIHLKVAGEKEAVQAEAILRQIHEILKTDVDGFQGAHRFVCKEHWDVKYFARFSGVPALTSYMEGKVKTEKLEPLAKQLEKLSKDGVLHRQNFVADNWE